MVSTECIQQLDPLWFAHMLLRRRKYEECLSACDALLVQDPTSKAVWYIKTRALTKRNWISDADYEAEGVADILMDDNATAALPRPGTSMARPVTATKSTRPVTGSVRPMTGYLRPGSAARPGSAQRPGSAARPATRSITDALKTGRPNTSRPMSATGRTSRVATASLAAAGSGSYLDIERLDLRKHAADNVMARVLADYLLFFEHNARKAVDLCAHATVVADYKDWWWKQRLGKCYYQLGLLREAEQQFNSSLANQAVLMTVIDLSKVYRRLDQPIKVLEVLSAAMTKEQHVGCVTVQLATHAARVNEALGKTEDMAKLYRVVLQYDACNAEAISCMAAHHYHIGQPEVAAVMYHRLLQLGHQAAEVWCNLALCNFQADKLESCLWCFERALTAASDDVMADVWYNVGQVAAALGDLGWAYQCFKLATSVCPSHIEALTCMGTIEAIKYNNVQLAQSNYREAQRYCNASGMFLVEPWYNAALLSLREGQMDVAHQLVVKALDILPEHEGSIRLMDRITMSMQSLQ